MNYQSEDAKGDECKSFHGAKIQKSFESTNFFCGKSSAAARAGGNTRSAAAAARAGGNGTIRRGAGRARPRLAEQREGTAQRGARTMRIAPLKTMKNTFFLLLFGNSKRRRKMVCYSSRTANRNVLNFKSEYLKNQFLNLNK